MSCAALTLAASLALADMYGAGPAAQPAMEQAQASPLSREPLYADIVGRARVLQTEVEKFRALPGLQASAAPVALPGFAAFKTDAAKLAELDMQGHFDLAKRGTDGDLKCILKGISQDIAVKVQAVEDAKTGADQDRALDDLAYLLNDNVGVITAPPKPPV